VLESPRGLGDSGIFRGVFSGQQNSAIGGGQHRKIFRRRADREDL
jgi:hypothetical protein